MIIIGDNVTIAEDVQFVTHDNSIMKVDNSCYNLVGFIKIGNNCFVGQRSTVLYGVTLADSIIVAAGSVVVNSFDEEKIIIGGNPAKKIGTWDSFIEKSRYKAMSRSKIKSNIIEHPELFVQKPVKR